MTTIPDLMTSVSQVLTTADELLADGDGEQVGALLASFLRTLLVDLDKLLVDQGPTGVRPQPRSQAPQNVGNKASRRPIPNRFPGTCVRCGVHVLPMFGFVIPTDVQPIDGKGKKWITYCQVHYEKEFL